MFLLCLPFRGKGLGQLARGHDEVGLGRGAQRFAIEQKPIALLPAARTLKRGILSPLRRRNCGGHGCNGCRLVKPARQTAILIHRLVARALTVRPLHASAPNGSVRAASSSALDWTTRSAPASSKRAVA